MGSLIIGVLNLIFICILLVPIFTTSDYGTALWVYLLTPLFIILPFLSVFGLILGFYNFMKAKDKNKALIGIILNFIVVGSAVFLYVRQQNAIIEERKIFEQN